MKFKRLINIIARKVLIGSLRIIFDIWIIRKIIMDAILHIDRLKEPNEIFKVPLKIDCSRNSSQSTKNYPDSKEKLIESLLIFERKKNFELIKAGNFSENFLQQLNKKIAGSDISETFPTHYQLNAQLNYLAKTFTDETLKKSSEILLRLCGLSSSLEKVKDKMQGKISFLATELGFSQQYANKIQGEKGMIEKNYEKLKKDYASLESKIARNSYSFQSEITSQNLEIEKQLKRIQISEIENSDLKVGNNENSKCSLNKDVDREGSRKNGWVKDLNTESTYENVLARSSENEFIEELKLKYEQLLCENLALKGEIVCFETEIIEGRRHEVQIEALKTKVSTQEKIIKELENNAKQDISEDSLDLNLNGIKEAIELQEIKEALRTISQRYEQDKENILKDCEESRQDMEAQLFRIKQEKFYMESVNKDMEKHLVEISAEKEIYEKEVFRLKDFIEKLKDCRTPKTPNSQKSYQRSETEMTSSIEFDFTHSIETSEKCHSLQHITLPEVVLEQFNEISLEIQKNQKIDINTANTVLLIRNTLEHMLNIKSILDEEISNRTSLRETSKNLSDVCSKLRLRVKNIEEESHILSKKVDYDSFDRVQTEPSPLFANRGKNELLFYYKKQLQIEKAKVLEKKHVIKLHKEQIAFLKASLREQQSDLNKSKSVNISTNKDLVISIFTEVPILAKSIENMIEVFLRFLHFSPDEIYSLAELRNSKKL